MDRVDSMTKVPPPDNNGRRVGAVSASSLMCAAHPSAQNHLSTCHFPFAFKGPFLAAWTVKLSLRKTVILPRDSNSLAPSVIHCSN